MGSLVQDEALKVAFVVRRFGGSGGTEKIARLLAAGLVGRSHEVTVYAARAEQVPEGVEAHIISGDNRVSFFRASYGVPDAEHDVVLGFGRSYGHDVFRAGGGSHAAWMERRDDTPWKRVRSAWSFSEQFELRVDRQAVTSARRVICNSELGKSDIVRTYGIEPGDITVVRNGVDLQRFRPDVARRVRAREEWGCEGRTALFVGSGFERKGLLDAARAFEMIADPTDRFVVIGTDRHEARFRDAVADLLGNRLRWLGARHDPEAWMPGADAVVLPTRYDPSANSTLEALASAVPAVTTSCDGAAEIVPFDELVVRQPDDTDAIAAALRYAWQCDDVARARCRQVAESWPGSRMCDEVCDVLERVAAEKER